MAKILRNIDQIIDTQGNDLTAPVLSFRNKFINGNFDIWQRGTSQNSIGFESADRWSMYHNVADLTLSREEFDIDQTNVPGHPKYYLRGTVVGSSDDASGQAAFTQKIEDVQTFSNQTVTLSFWAKADSNKNISTEFRQNFGTGDGVSSAINEIGISTYNLTTSWQKFTTTVSIPSVAGKTIGLSSCFQMNVFLDAGSNMNSRTNSLGSQSGVFDFSQFQIEEGTVTTPFEHRLLSLEQSLCERYWRWGKFKFGGRATTGSGNRDNIFFSTTMRVHPTVALFNEIKNGIGTTFPEQGSPNHVTVYWLGSTDSDTTTYYGEYSADAEL